MKECADYGIVQKKCWRDLFITPDIVTLKLWSYLDNNDLLKIASLDETLKQTIFTFYPHLSTPCEKGILSINMFGESPTAAQLKIIFKIYDSE